MTQENLAYKLDVSRQSVSKWESDISLPEMEKVIKLCEILEINCDYLLKSDVSETGFPSTPTLAAVPSLPEKGISTGAFVFCMLTILFGILLFLFGIVTFFAIAVSGLPNELIPSAIFMGVGLVLFLTGMIAYFALKKR